MNREQTIYVLTRATVINNTLEPQDIDSWVFPSFEEANEAMVDDWVATYDKTHGNPHDECEVPKKKDKTAWIQFDDGDLEFIWHIVKGVLYAKPHHK